MVIYLDGADLSLMAQFHDKVSGFTTNPSLMRKAGISHYSGFAKHALVAAKGKPISFEVFADDMEGMNRQAREISSWGENVYVKIPCTNTKGESTDLLIRRLASNGIKLNITAVMTFEQINNLCRCLTDTPAIFSIFCGRIADTGRDPIPFITRALTVKQHNTKVLWASTREVLNVRQAQQVGCDIITLTPDLLKKTEFLDRNLSDYSLETVKMFYDDSRGFSL